VVQVNDLETAIISINRQSTDTALQDVHTRRSLGQGSILNQNTLLEAVNAFLPSISVGVKSIPLAPFGGTLAFISGGRGYRGGLIDPSMAFSFDSETIYPIDLRLSEQRSYMGTLNATAVGVLAGGGGNAGFSSIIDLVDFAKPSMRRSAVSLAVPMRASPGVGDRSNGVFLGGSSSTNLATRNATSYNHSAGTLTERGNALTGARMSPHNGISGPTEGAVLGGSDSNPVTFWDNPILTVEVMNLSTFVVVPGGNSLTYAHTSHGAFGNRTVGYVCGGMSNLATQYSSLITKYTHATRTTVPIGSALPTPRICLDGVASGKAGYLFGGDTAASNWQGSRTITKFEYLLERVSTLGNQLSTSCSDQGVTCDYLP
jgi:hypothetical protein